MEKKKEFKETSKFSGTIKGVRIIGNVLITDPCYLVHGIRTEGRPTMSWDEIVQHMNLRAYVENSTLYGDWGCTVFRVTKNDIRPFKNRAIGNFCADSGSVCVCDYDEVCHANPGFEEWCKNHKWCACVIRDFVGDVSLELYKNTFMFEGEICTENELRVHGVGKIGGRRARFMSYQTSL